MTVPRTRRNEKHGMYYTPEYKLWRNIRQRTSNPKSSSYYNYGARGITMHPAWRDSFLTFYKDVGTRPSPAYSIDRIDVNGNYEPGNVRWATRTTQAHNKRRRPMLKVTKTLGVVVDTERYDYIKGLADQQGISVSALLNEFIDICTNKLFKDKTT